MMGKLHVSAYSGHLLVLTTFLLKEFYIICIHRVVMLRSHHHFACFFKLILVGRKMMMRSQHHRAVYAYYIKLF